MRRTISPVVSTASIPLRFMFLLLAAAAACTSGSGLPEIKVAPDELLAGEALGMEKGAADLVEERDVLAVSAEMKQFLDVHVDQRAAPRMRLHQLLDAIIESGTFQMKYETITRTASETFHERRGNCLSYALMFVAMAREVGLKAGFQEVDVPPDWTSSDQTYQLNWHVNVFIDFGGPNQQIVDFNVSNLRTSHDMWKIEDGRALAHYYNNLGVDAMQNGDVGSAFTYFRRSLAQGEPYSPGWIHIGILYKRNGDLDLAEAAYLRALQIDPRNLVAMSNLALVYEASGGRELAQQFRRRVAAHRSENPYYRYQLARRAYETRQYDEAIGHLEFAVARRPKEHRFHSLLGLAHYRKGNLRAASRSFERAREVAASQSEKEHYSAKIAALSHLGRD